MRTIGFLSWVAAACIVVVPAAQGDARSSTPQSSSSKFSVDVTVTGTMPHVSGGVSDLFLTFSAPVQIPRADLAAGTYVFTKVGSSAVRVTSTDRATVYSMFITVPAMRTGDVDHAQVRFVRDAPGAHPRVFEIYPEGSSTGYAPMYPKGHKASVAGATTSPE